jgi:MFS family permease
MCDHGLRADDRRQPAAARRGRAHSRTGRSAGRDVPGPLGCPPAGHRRLPQQVGSKPLVALGVGTQAVALGLVALAGSFGVWALASVLLGVGAAMVYPTLLAAVGDVAHPAWRTRVGVYRLWRYGGFAVGALVFGLIADAWGCGRRSGWSRRCRPWCRRCGCTRPVPLGIELAVVLMRAVGDSPLPNWPGPSANRNDLLASPHGAREAAAERPLDRAVRAEARHPGPGRYSKETSG